MNKNEIKSNFTKKKLCDTYISLYKKKNIDQITIKEITDKAGYNRGTFYIYYKDVYDIHDKIKKNLIKKGSENALKNIKNNKEISFEDLYKAIITFYSENENYLGVFITKDSNFRRNIKETLKPLLNKVFQKDPLNKETDYLIEYHLSAVFGVLNLWISEKKNISKEEIFNLLYIVSTNGVITTFLNQK